MAGKLVRDLAADLGLRLADLLGQGSGFGHFTSGRLEGAVSFVSGRYRWDVHHERPVDSPEGLAVRELLEYRVHFADGRVEEWRPPEPDPGIHSRGPGRFEYQPPLPALQYAASIGVPDAIAESVGIYMDRFRLVVLTESGSTLPVWEGQTVEAWLDGYPSGERIPDAPPVTARCRLAPADRVRHVYLKRAGDKAGP